MRTGVDLAPLTHVRIGGLAETFWDIRRRADLDEALAWRRVRGLDECLVIGGGANVLVNDERTYPMVVKLERQFGAIREETGGIVVEAGAPLSRLVRVGVERGWDGFDRLAGIPGTAGGAAVMNAGIPGFEIFDLILEVRGVDPGGHERRFTPADLAPAYRHGNVPPDVIVTELVLARRSGDPHELAATARRLKDDRRAKQPLQLPSFGSTFVNPPFAVVEGGAQTTAAGAAGTTAGAAGTAGAAVGPSGWGGGSAGALIERAGLKGARRGNAQLSELHANWVLNLGGAHARDVLELLILARRTVGERFGVWLEPEVRLVGFTAEELARLREAA